MKIYKLDFNDILEIYDIYPINLDNSDYTKKITIKDNKYNFSDLHYSIIEEFFSKIIFTKTVSDGFLTVKCIKTGEVLKSNKCIKLNLDKFNNYSIFTFNKNKFMVFFYDGVIMYYYPKQQDFYYSDPHLYGRTDRDLWGNKSNKWDVDKKELYGSIICHRAFHKRGNIKYFINTIIPKLNNIKFSEDNNIIKTKFNIYINFSKITGHYTWFNFITFEYIINNNLLDKIDKIYYSFEKQDWFDYKRLFEKYPNKFIKGYNSNVNYLYFTGWYINKSTKKLFNYNVNKIYAKMNKDKINNLYKILNLNKNNFNILINLKKNRRVCINGEDFFIKAINQIHNKFPNVNFYYSGLWNTNKGDEFNKVEKTFMNLKTKINNKDKLYNINGLDIRLIHKLCMKMNYSIGQTGGGPREFSEWMLNLSTFVIDKYYGHPVTPFICYKKFCQTFGMNKCKLPQGCLIDTTLNPEIQKKFPIIELPDFKLTDKEIDDRIDLLLEYIKKIYNK